MNATILSIGDELILGQTIDTNSAWLSQQLAAIGCGVLAHYTIADDQDAIADAIAYHAPKSDVILITGGLGPTEDDLTRQALAQAMGVGLELCQPWLTQLEEFFRMRRRPMVASNRVQAMLPATCSMIPNTCGTACGMAGAIGRCDIYAMPGVPHEMVEMFTRDILPKLRERSHGAVILSRTLHSFGVGESSVGEMLGDLMDRRRNPSVGTTVSGGVVSLRINARFDDAAEARRQIETTEAACRARLGSLIYGADGITLSEVLAVMLKRCGKTVCTAESCTGGLLAGMFTDVPGSSAYFLHGQVTYSNDAKVKLLGVKPATLERYGAVSESVVKEMAVGARKLSGADFALSISGIAGPDGGTPDKPVGTVCFGFAHAAGVTASTIVHLGSRSLIRDRACKTAMTILRYHLLNEPLPF